MAAREVCFLLFGHHSISLCHSPAARKVRWSPFVGQFGDLAKLGSGSPQAANLSFSPLRAMPAA